MQKGMVIDMKKKVRKNQMIITALAIMIVVAGYLNFTGQEISTTGGMFAKNQEAKNEKKESAKEESKEKKEASESKETTDISQEDIEENYQLSDDGELIASEENPGEAVMVSNSLNKDYFSSAKLSREQSRAKNKETLMEIINNKSIAQAQKKAAIDEVAQITEMAEKENATELMLEAKGFTDAVVSIGEKSVDVVVNAEELSQQQIAQIEDIVRRKTEASAENIVITPVSIKK